uniref:Uncharacterized protein n=1 Tax=Oryza meridionalis TaxID=40149 RepID=A0A0E0EX13_9ORYZ
MAEQPIGHSPEANTLSPTSSPLPLSPITIHASPFTPPITLPRPFLSSRHIDHIGGRGRRWRALASSRRWADGSSQQPAALPLPQPRRASGRRQQPEEPDSSNPDEKDLNINTIIFYPIIFYQVQCSEFIQPLETAGTEASNNGHVVGSMLTG